MTYRQVVCGLALLIVPAIALAWWNDEWPSRRQVMVDAGTTGADIRENLSDFPLLIRLHRGNFPYFAELAADGKDIRFLRDDTNALKHQVEKFDAFNELGLIWVKLLHVEGGSSTGSFWFFYGNADAPDGSDGRGVYDVHQSLVYHFAEGESIPRDATAYNTNAQDSGATIEPSGWIGAAARFSGNGHIGVAASPQLAIDPDNGWTFSAWFKIDQNQTDAELLQAIDTTTGLELKVQGQMLSARYRKAERSVEVPQVKLQLGKWQHVDLVARRDRLDLFLDGAMAGSAAIELLRTNPVLSFGGNLVGSIDELQIAGVARSADWIKLAFRSQSPDFAVLGFGQDETGSGSSTGHFEVIADSVTPDGWVVIGLTGIMFVIAVLVMIFKGLVISRVTADNRAFLEKYRQLSIAQFATLNREDSDVETELGDSDLLTALIGKHDHFQSSPLYHLYHAGIQELKAVLDEAEPPIPPEVWNLLRVRLGSRVVMEHQRLNSNMVLLTIAIAGGPFLGLLGTVMGVMITFATIAATGDVNINSIAPGIAAALLATVAGLGVAIPSLFGYNYLLTRIKEVSTEMQVFADEFLALLAVWVVKKQARQNG